MDEIGRRPPCAAGGLGFRVQSFKGSSKGSFKGYYRVLYRSFRGSFMGRFLNEESGFD